eukprot:scaffold2308_cov103-Cylindrotheca_fusiformis.AAC.2
MASRDGIPTTRRRSNSSSNTTTNNNTTTGGGNNNNNNNNTSIATSRPKRRSRGLPLSSTTTTTTKPSSSNKPTLRGKNNETSTENKPEEGGKRTSSRNRSSTRRSSNNNTTTTTNSSSRNNNTTTTSNPKKKTSSAAAAATSPDLVAMSQKKEPFHVHLTINGEPYNSASSSPSSAKDDSTTKKTNNRSNGSPKEEPKEEEEENSTPPTTKASSSVKKKKTKKKQQQRNKSSFSSSSKPAPPAAASGGGDDDHNLFHCHFCHKLGSVVCCDGCPRVFHKNCIPESDPSRQSLEENNSDDNDDDDDPWYCPYCHPDGEQQSQEQLCLVCLKPVSVMDDDDDDNSNSNNSEELHTCTGCGGWIHASCIQEDDEPSSLMAGGSDNDDDDRSRGASPALICDKCQEAKMATTTTTTTKSSNSKMMATEEDDDPQAPPPLKRRKLAGGGAKSSSSSSSPTKDNNNDDDDDDDQDTNENDNVENHTDDDDNDDIETMQTDDNDDNDDEKEDDDDDDDQKSSGDETRNSTSPTMITRRTRSASASEAAVKTDEEEEDEEEEDEEDSKDNEDENGNDDDDDEEKETEDEQEDMGEDDDDDDEETEGEDVEEESLSKSSKKSSSGSKTSPRKRSRVSLPSSRASSSRISSSAKQKKEKAKKVKDGKKKKKKKKGIKSPKGSPSSSTSGKMSSEDVADGSSPNSTTSSSSYGAHAIPAFYFYLAENRLKIERSLSRRHRYFNRLPKGMERNELVAKEGASWWVKLRRADVQRYMDMSMKDFEQRIIEWKEEKNLQEMVTEPGLEESIGGGAGGGSDPSDLTPEDERMAYERHTRLYLGTTVGCKPFKPEPGVSHNRILLELLQDMRFHPAPMLMANRTEQEYGQMDFARITIPYFDAHGPVSTSMGDECLGCTRGWTHYCNVLKRRIPAVEHRAKLQPPLSSLMATRVGLGLQSKHPNDSSASDEEPEQVKDLEMYSSREDPEAIKAKTLPDFHWEPLSNPSERADDIVQFIEESVAMKVPEPPRPPNPSKLESSKKSGFGRVALPLRGRKRSFDGDGDMDTLNKCGRCRTVIQTDTGCIQCRRAQLVINMSREGGDESGDANGDNADMSHFLKVSTHMLGRVTMKEGSGETQPDGDQAIANGILRQRWTPFAVLPAQKLNSPLPKPSGQGEESDDEESSTDDSSSSSDETKEAEPIVPIAVTVDETSVDSNEDQSVGGKRYRSARLGAQATSVEEKDEIVDRQKMAQKYKEEASELNKKCVQKACCGILLGLMRRDPLLLFARPVRAEGYSAIIKNPIDFEKIRSNVLGKKYSTLGSFVSDARLLCTNALTYNPPGSIYWKTAKELYDVLVVMQKRASDWIGSVKDCHANAWRSSTKVQTGIDEDDIFVDNAFEELKKQWPEAVEMLEDSDWLQKDLSADFMRTKENETAYYGGLAVRRAAVAAEAALAPYPDQAGIFNTVGRRTHIEDDMLRNLINERVADDVEPMQLKDLPTWREESIIRVMRRSQSRRLDGLIGSINGCARCDGMRVDQDLKMAMTAETLRWGRSRKKNSAVPRVASSRIDLSTGLGSQNAQETIKEQEQKMAEAKDIATKSVCAQKAAVAVRGSRIHGWGLYADQPFHSGDIVAEYIGEYVSHAVTEAREKMYQTQRIQDYQFRLDERLVIDATMRGGHGRYINHNCSPNCVAKIIAGEAPNEHLKRVLIVAQRDIKPREELTYDYQFPLELNLKARIPCNCHSEHCRGFMNWDLPEKGSNSRVFRSQKRGANMRDRIRRLGRPLKGDK